jgi:hypothetical protein
MRCVCPDYRKREFFEGVHTEHLNGPERALRQPGDDRVTPLGEAARKADGEEDHAF